ncbi:MAG TPA: DUF72 domain-containing protein [Pyrinomonadaceae bacterium]|nr:DUF72 domain-containing protein [Pyrinomonadaceae bacterium]
MSDYANIYVGCQGWNYDDWVTPAGASRVFYPRGTRAEGMLALYARAFHTVEVDSTFYAVPAASTVEGWRKRTPERFTFSLKLPQEITHRHALRGAHAARVFESFCENARLLGDKLAAVLVQLPPAFEAVPENLRALGEFLPLLPRDLRFAFEFRDYGWFERGTTELLARYGASLALVEGPWVSRARVWELAEVLTETDAGARFVYVRWMGERDLVRFDAVQREREENLREWADLLKEISARGREVFAYFSNFYEGHAPASANRLKRLLGQTIVAPEDLETQPSLF